MENRINNFVKIRNCEIVFKKLNFFKERRREEILTKYEKRFPIFLINYFDQILFGSFINCVRLYEKVPLLQGVY